MEVTRTRRKFMLFRHPDAPNTLDLLVGRGYQTIDDLRIGESVSLFEKTADEVIIDKELLEMVYTAAAKLPLTPDEKGVLNRMKRALFHE